MRILRLTNSNDVLADIPVDLRGAAVAERAVAEAIGETVETVQRVIWPGPELPAIVDRWIANYQPDVVFIRIPSATGRAGSGSKSVGTLRLRRAASERRPGSCCCARSVATPTSPLSR